MRKVNLIAVLAVVGTVAMSVPAFAGDWVASGSTWEYYENGSRTASKQMGARCEQSDMVLHQR